MDRFGLNAALIVGVLVATIFVLVDAKEGYGPGEQDYGFVEVRGGAHLFYWLYYTSANVESYDERPLVIWLQGGPGASSTGYGNFEELGPLDLYGNERNHTWVKEMNVLFIDNPVGAGFSYVENMTLLTKNNHEIARDLVEFMRQFYKIHSKFENVPLHIFCESYGGKMAPEFALELHHEIQKGKLRSNLISVALGDPWTSPVDSVNSWAPFLLFTGIVDEDGYKKIKIEAEKTESLTLEGKWISATSQWSYTQRVVLQESKGVDFYNIETKTRGDRAMARDVESGQSKSKFPQFLIRPSIDEDRNGKLEDLMRGEVSEALGIPPHVVWGSQSDLTFSALSGDFMKPVVHIVEELLNNTNVQVGVFSGQLDLICATAGAVNWINKMNWNGKEEYIKASREGITVDHILEGYTKRAGNFSMFWIDRAGHMVPNDNPAGMSFVLKMFTNYG